MTIPRLRGRLSSALLILLWPFPPVAQAAQPTARAKGANAVEPQPLIEHEGWNDLDADSELELELQERMAHSTAVASPAAAVEPDPPKQPSDLVNDNPKLLVATVAGARGVTDPTILVPLERYYRRRRIQIQSGAVGAYRFIEGETMSPMTESEFIVAYQRVTGEKSIDIYSPSAVGKYLSAALILTGGLLVTYGAHQLLSGRNCGGDVCEPTPALLSGVGALVGTIGGVTFAMAGPPTDPTIHRIPLATAGVLVPAYNRALIHWALTQLQSRHPRALESGNYLPSRRDAPTRPLANVELRPGGLLLRF